MTRETWTAVDRYLEERLIPPDPALAAALEASNQRVTQALDQQTALAEVLRAIATSPTRSRAC